MTTKKSDRINYSWNFSQSQNSATISNPIQQGLWAFDDCAVFPLPNQRLLLKSKRTDNRVVVSSEVFQALQLCRQFKSLEEHAAVVKEMNPSLTAHRAEINQVFNKFIEQGFMVSAKDLALSLQYRGETIHQSPLFGILIRTCDRPRQLERLMKSFYENELHYGKHYQYFVIDDSRDSENITENQLLVKNLKNNYGLNVHYHGWERQQELIKSLMKSFPEYGNSIQYLLGKNRQGIGFSGGRTWNYMLLLTAGRRFLTVDDDMICQPRLSPDYQNAFEISARQRQARFFLDRDDLLAKTAALEMNPITQHEDMLGYSLAQNTNRFSAIECNEQIFKHLSGDLIDTLHANSPVLLTQSGVFGDPGTFSTSWIFDLEGESRSQLIENLEAYMKRRTSRHLWLGTSNFRFSPDTSLVSTLTGIDNQRVLPPSNPYFRNEDYLFGTLVKFMIPNSLAMEFPWGLLHFPEPERNSDDKQLDEPYSVGLLGFLADVATNISKYCYASEPLKRLHFLAETYLSLADADSKVLEEGIEENLIHARVHKINSLHSHLNTYHDFPGYWADDIRRLLQANSHALMSKGQGLFSEILTYQNREKQVSIARDLLGDFGRGLKEWNFLWKYCEENFGSYYFEH
ncbi:MAG: hypothetical protein ACU4EQ_00185 [Candidatus Nitrosoglobus sp.]